MDLVYTLNVIIIVLYSFFIKDRKQYVIVASLHLFLFLALRSNTLGPDANYYNTGYYYIKSLNFSTLISKLHFFKTASLIYPFNYESGYVVLNWIVSFFGFSYHFFLIVCSAINMYAFGKLIYKYSKIPWLSFFILCSFGTFTYFIEILRHSLGLSFFILAIINLLDSNKRKAILFIVLAFLFHRSSIVLLPLLFIVDRKTLKKNNAIIILLLTIPFLFLSKYFYGFAYHFISLFGKSRYVGGSIHFNKLFFLLYLIYIIIIFFVNFEKQKDDKVFNLTFWALIFSIFFEIIGLYNEVMARSVQMYTSLLILLIPNVINMYEKQKSFLIIKMAIVISLILYMNYDLKGSKVIPYSIQKDDFLIDR